MKRAGLRRSIENKRLSTNIVPPSGNMQTREMGGVAVVVTWGTKVNDAVENWALARLLTVAVSVQKARASEQSSVSPAEKEMAFPTPMVTSLPPSYFSIRHLPIFAPAPANRAL